MGRRETRQVPGVPRPILGPPRGGSTSIAHFRVKRGMFARAQPLNAVNGVSLEIERGEVVAVVGESGCGKTTLARVLLGLDYNTAGAGPFGGVLIALAGDARSRPAHAAHIQGTVFIAQSAPHAGRDHPAPARRAWRRHAGRAPPQGGNDDGAGGPAAATACTAIRTSSPAASGSGRQSRQGDHHGAGTGDLRRADLRARRIGAIADTQLLSTCATTWASPTC